MAKNIINRKKNKNFGITLIVVLLAVLCLLVFFFVARASNLFLNFPVLTENIIRGFDVVEQDCTKLDEINTSLDCSSPKSSDRTDFLRYTDNDFANFRSLQSLGMKKNVIYRSSSPIDNWFGRAAQAASALQEAQIHNIVNLDNTEDEAKQIAGFQQSYYTQQNVLYAPLNVNSSGLLDTNDENNKTNIRKIFEFIAESDEPVLIHCKDGCDKTVFVCALLSCLTCSSYDYVKADYYQSNFSLRKIEDGQDTTSLRNQIDIKFRTLIGCPMGLSAQSTLSSNLNLYAKNYLLGCGVTEEIVQKVYEKVADL